MQPGQTIVPGQEPADQSKPPEPAAAPPDTTPPATTQPTAEPEPQPEPADTPPPEANWQFKGAGTDSLPDTDRDIPPISWTASEYVSHHKGASWFLMLGVVIVLAAIGMYALTRDVVSAVVIGMVGILFGAFGARKPRVLEYRIDSQGVHIAEKTYAYGLFRSFSVQIDDGVHSILLMPAQRFGLPITLYYEPKDEQSIVETLGMSLPLEERNTAPIDRFMSKIRF